MDPYPLAVSPTRDLRDLSQFLFGLVLVELYLDRQTVHSLLEFTEESFQLLIHFVRRDALYASHSDNHVLEARVIGAAVSAQQTVVIPVDVAQT